MAAKYILAVLSLVFLAAAVGRMATGHASSHPQTRTWLIISILFGGVAAWLFAREG